MHAIDSDYAAISHQQQSCRGGKADAILTGMSFIWADKISIGVFGLFALLGWGMCGGYNLNWTQYDNWLWLVGTLAAMLWCFLRLVDFLAGGPIRRASRRDWR
jgi:hypothetical protein